MSFSITVNTVYLSFIFYYFVAVFDLNFNLAYKYITSKKINIYPPICTIIKYYYTGMRILSFK